MSEDQDYIYITHRDADEEAETSKTPRALECAAPEPTATDLPERATTNLDAPPPLLPPGPEYTRPDYLRMGGATAPDGAPWIHVQVDCDEGSDAQPDRSVWTRLADWEGDAGAAKRRLSTAHIHLPPDEAKKAFTKAWSVKEFPALPLIEHPGWTVPHYALPSGEVFSPPGADPAVILYEKDLHRCAVKGSSADWMKGVARLAKGQSIITFALMIPFVAALLKLSPIMFNPGFELTGPQRRGKSTLQQKAASIMGAAVGQQGRNYVLPANTTVNQLEIATQDHRDLPLIIEDMSLYYAGESDKVRAQKMRELVMRLAEGSVKARQGEPSPPRTRFVYLTSANETLTSMFGGHHSWALSAARDRLLTIPMAEKRKYGIFDRLPKGCTSGKEAVRAIVRLIEDHHGHSIRIFLPELVARRAADEEALKVRIEALINEFRDAVGVDDNSGPESSIADVFGLVYAAGMLAQEYGALPAKLKLLRAAVKVHGLNRAMSIPPPTYLERLRLLADRKGVIHVDARDLKDISDEVLKAAPALLRTNRSGVVELMLTDTALRRAFFLKNRMLKDPDIKAIMRTDKDGRNKVSVRIRSNCKQERLYAFAMPDQNEDD